MGTASLPGRRPEGRSTGRSPACLLQAAGFGKGGVPVVACPVVACRWRRAGAATKEEGPARETRGAPMDHGQDALMATSSSTKLVCRDESSVPLNDSVTVWPA
ncbi:hypothetical protein GCM10023195_08910 [Actinoallomurus liliacearum]|uniref:Uncharacterized protein n=1 Tax=Actinoallomurus liliacearum TaxID=1080073 RepID=A0ABP8TD48_9ACTN